MEMKHAGPRSLFYTAQEVAQLFHVSPKTIYKKADEFGGEWVAGCLRFAKNRINMMARERGADVSA